MEPFSKYNKFNRKGEKIMKEILSLNNLTQEDILTILDTAHELEINPQPKKLENKILSTVFFEPSTRTKLSFISAMYRLGGKVIELDGGGNNSLKKGETISDTLTMMGLYTDIMAIRSLYEGTAKRASEILDIPVINAGDGANQHPTQTLLDLYTIRKEHNRLNNLNIAFVGDLKYGRTVHSLSKALDKFNGNKIYFIAPPEMQIPSYITNSLNSEYEILDEYEEIMPNIDILYMTRIQEERFDNPDDFKKCSGKYVIDKEILKISKKDMKILHPLPRVGEIHTNLDNTPNAVYFNQAKNGIFIRQAIISLLIENFEKSTFHGVGHKCNNPKCISQIEDLGGKYINYKDKKICFYCEK